ncbi:curli production assembly/transport component CsgF [Pontibacter indicus]|uniref:Curli production assembly/transport component CsgF n=1 Tax=Pontibacter indicus TaxID=1317125 RepID=A0A1R3XNW4_9BACT|nr:curli production assembly/transport component CsgF [Pontibacter indicus]SIT93626.1 curli production assembly/transport component CsgF [Pontibacter indicus]
MKKNVYALSLALMLCLLFSEDVSAQDMVYQAKNPAFGGETFNYQWLQSSAQAQDKLKDPNESNASLFNRDPLKDFQESLNRQILNQLSRQLVTSQFGEEGLAPGEYTIGNYDIEVSEGMSGISINILDKGTGNRTTVTIPYY